MSSGGNGLDLVVGHLSKGVGPTRSIASSRAIERGRRARPKAEVRDQQLFALALLTVASLCLVVAACVYTSAFRIESACSLAGDPVCAAARHRVAATAATAGTAVFIGLVAAIDFVRRAKGGRTR